MYCYETSFHESNYSSSYFFSCSCSFFPSNFEKAILSTASNNCGQDINNCKIHLEEVLGIEWDSMFVFSEYTHSEDVSEHWDIKFNFSMVKDSYERIVLVFEGKVIYSEEFSSRRSKIQHPYLKNPIINTKLGFKVKRIKNHSKFNLIQNISE